ncbi:MAG: hypothetical protein ACK5LK_08685, partial [Chthoniobacterales bacterium]
TSDEERTKITPATTHLLMLINSYSGSEGLQEAAEYAMTLLRKYAGAGNLNIVFNSSFPPFK